MNYSFTQPGKKTFFKKVSRIWWGYILLTLFIFIGFLVILKAQGHYMQKNAQAASQTQKILLEEIKSLQKQLISEQEKVQFAEYITHQNTLLKESVENLFGLIPEQITLNKIQMEQYQLTLYGTTPSKQIYTFLLEVPLRSIFHQSRADFYMLPNGWYNFVSVSKLEETE
ncbi:hypothetical protein [Helicobacter winghamensis]|uniref:Uncharacterized protein n=3 Tax=Helicobacter winghamensis TaxID=157268 RepID=A0A2N3PJS5_9HELI|nr:hypothetical protein [Helicobacter winghamensis]EEO26277.1 hypothetical protein HWAG_01069 [Helicobacter winghamensis ATCC BAA-430]PKT77269.1 hypothetical protein BCM32_02680 [Helicobacter winghamensis]PKT77469.1 hypothetical protein BCM34_00745 [Helicobacter winghamensis]PKT77798.1 hypothetical protein BCM35_02255 [Helicobacter winghamensis]PKT81435.1 hypothetical protein BCM31_07155 [Helicobacter winghamensis]